MICREFEFESRELTDPNNNFYLTIKVHYRMSQNPEIELIQDEFGRKFQFLELPVMDGLYILERIKQMEGILDKDIHDGVDEAYEAGLDKKRLD